MPFLFVHGLGQNASSWDKTTHYIQTVLDFTCLDLPKMLAGEQVSYPALYRAFSQYCDGFSEPLHLCGLSLGGVLSLHYCIDHPERVGSLVLIGTQYKMPKQLLAAAKCSVSSHAIFGVCPDRLWQKDFMALCRSMMALDFSQSLCQVSCPALVICGEKDRPNQKAAKELAELLPVAKLQSIPGAGHEVNTDQPERLAKALDTFYAYAAK